MNKQTSIKASASLLERAAEIYDFQAQLRAPAKTQPEPVKVLDLDATQIIEPQAPPAVETPVVQRAAARQQTRQFAAIDRERLREGGFLLPDAPTGALTEEFRIIKRQLLRDAGSQGTRSSNRQTILVASAQPEDGKSFCALNLALSMAGEKDLEVLLIDGDFAKPALPALLGIEEGLGLIDAIADAAADPNDFVIGTDVPGLSLLRAGTRVNNVTELLASARTSEVLRALTDSHPNRILIFDSTPALVASPAAVLASHAGQVMMVVRADRTTEADLRESLSLLSACKSISLVLNGTRLTVGGARFGAYYGYGQ